MAMRNNPTIPASILFIYGDDKHPGRASIALLKPPSRDDKPEHRVYQSLADKSNWKMELHAIAYCAGAALKIDFFPMHIANRKARDEMRRIAQEIPHDMKVVGLKELGLDLQLRVQAVLKDPGEEIH